MIIANIKPDHPQTIDFDLQIEGTTSEPESIRFIIESQQVDGQQVQDLFSVICRVIRTETGIKVFIPKLLNLFKSGTYRASLEVVLEGRVFVPLSEELQIEPPITIKVTESLIEYSKEQKKILKPTEIQVKVNSTTDPIVEEQSKKQINKQEPKDWKDFGFKPLS